MPEINRGCRDENKVEELFADSGGGVVPPYLGIIYVTGFFGLSSDLKNFGRKVKAKDIQYS